MTAAVELCLKSQGGRKCTGANGGSRAPICRRKRATKRA
jgi:hypothetical protein